jgi:hypothetical protein
MTRPVQLELEAVPMPPPVQKRAAGQRVSPWESRLLRAYHKAVRDQARRIFGAHNRYASCEDDVAQDISIHIVRMARGWFARGHLEEPPPAMVWATIRNARNRWRRDANRSTKHVAAAEDACLNGLALGYDSPGPRPDDGDNQREAAYLLGRLAPLDAHGVIVRLADGVTLTGADRRALAELRRRARRAGIVPGGAGA